MSQLKELSVYFHDAGHHIIHVDYIKADPTQPYLQQCQQATSLFLSKHGASDIWKNVAYMTVGADGEEISVDHPEMRPAA